MNFRIYWDGDLQDELLDGTKIDKWNGSGTTRLYIKGKNPSDYGSSSSCNGTKNTPNLQADLFGDWREEIILWNSADAATLNVFSTAEPTTYRVPTLMHDHTYRMGVAWQNVAYNQPPHLGYYLPDFIESFQGNDPTGIHELKNEPRWSCESCEAMPRPLSTPLLPPLWIISPVLASCRSQE